MLISPQLAFDYVRINRFAFAQRRRGVREAAFTVLRRRSDLKGDLPYQRNIFTDGDESHDLL